MTTPVDGLAILKTLPYKAQHFCREYILDFNGKAAATRAGYSARSAHSTASKLLTKANIQLSIQALAQKHAQKLDLTAERLLTEVSRLAFHDPGEMFDTDGKLKKIRDMNADTRACIASYDGKTKSVTTHNKNQAIALAARILRLVDSDVAPVMNGNFVVITPADATHDQWQVLAQAQMAAMLKPASPLAISSNGHHTNGSNGSSPHASNGNGG